MVRLFLVFTNIWQEDVAIIPKVPGAPRNVYPAPRITWLVDVTIFVPFLNNNSPPPRQFLCTKYLKKNYLGKMLIEQIIEF